MVVVVVVVGRGTAADTPVSKPILVEVVVVVGTGIGKGARRGGGNSFEFSSTGNYSGDDGGAWGDTLLVKGACKIFAFVM